MVYSTVGLRMLVPTLFTAVERHPPPGCWFGACVTTQLRGSACDGWCGLSWAAAGQLSLGPRGQVASGARSSQEPQRGQARRRRRRGKHPPRIFSLPPNARWTASLSCVREVASERSATHPSTASPAARHRASASSTSVCVRAQVNTRAPSLANSSTIAALRVHSPRPPQLAAPWCEREGSLRELQRTRAPWCPL